MSKLLLALSALVPTAPAVAQEAADPFQARLEPFIEALVADWDVPGLAVGIVRDGELAYARAFGVESVETGEPITVRSLFHMASVSKTFVATAVLQLVEEGKIELDAPIVEYLDDFNLNDERIEGVTVRRMLQHTSGIPDTNDYGWDRPELDDGALARYVRGLSDLALEFDPGTRWAYSNVAYEVLGHLVATVSGESFEGYEKRHVLEPLGMSASSFLRAETDPELRTVGHVWELGAVVAPVYPYNRAHAPSSTLHSSVEEMSLWMRAHLGHGVLDGKRILRAETHDEMWRAGPVTEIDGQRMGLGWFQGSVRGHETWGHRGGDTGFRSWMELVPDASLGVAVLCNSSQGNCVQLVAEAALDVALGFDSGFVPTPMRYVFARTLRSRGVEAAIQEYLELREARPREIAIRTRDLLEIGSLLIEHERVDEALDVFALCVDEDPLSARAMACLGGAYRLLGEEDEARNCFRASLELDPSDEEVREALRELEAPSTDSIRCDLSSDQVNVSVTIDGGGPFWFIVDTGASVEGCIDRSLAEELGLETTGEVEVGDGSGRGDLVVPLTRARVVIGATDLGPQELLVGDYRRPMSEGRVRLGILGIAAFQHHSLAIDIPRRTVELCAGPLLEGVSEHDVELPEAFEAGDDLLVPLRIGEVELEAVVDTGSASALNLPSAWLEEIEIVGEPRVTGLASTRTNTYEIRTAELAHPIRLAGYDLEEGNVTCNDHHDVAILGNGLLSRFRLTIELARGRMRFELASDRVEPPLVEDPQELLETFAAAYEAQEEQGVRALLEPYERGDVPGCAIGVVRHGELVFADGAGIADLDHGIPIDSRTAFDIASVSKQFTAAAILLLCERGELSLDDDVRRYVRELPDYGAPITLEHLVHHTSGIRDYVQLLWLAGLSERSPWTRSELIDLICRQRHLTFPPGEEHYYSNSGYLLLGAVVERVSGRPFGDFLESELVLPLGMEDTVVYDDPGLVIRNRAIAYEPRGRGFAVDQYPEFAVPGDGGIYTTVEDLARWERGMAFGGVGSEDFPLAVQEPGLLNDGTSTDYAFGLELGTWNGLRLVSHDGGWGGFRAEVLRFPDEGLSVIVLANRADAPVKRLARDAAAIYLADRITPPSDEGEEDVEGDDSAPPQRPAVTLPPDHLARLAGTYRCAASGSVWELDVRDEKLGFQSILGGPRFVLEPESAEVFRVVSPPRGYVLRFAPDTTGFHRVAEEEEDAFQRIERHLPGPAELARLTGRYRSDELRGAVFDVFEEDERLFLERPDHTRQELVPISGDLFLTRDMDVRFRRDEEGEISGFSLSKWRLEDIGFDRMPPVK